MFFVYPQSNNTRLDLRGGNLPQNMFPHRHPLIEAGFLFFNKRAGKRKAEGQRRTTEIPKQRLSELQE